MRHKIEYYAIIKVLKYYSQKSPSKYPNDGSTGIVWPPSDPESKQFPSWLAGINKVLWYRWDNGVVSLTSYKHNDNAILINNNSRVVYLNMNTLWQMGNLRVEKCCYHNVMLDVVVEYSGQFLIMFTHSRHCATVTEWQWVSDTDWHSTASGSESDTDWDRGLNLLKDWLQLRKDEQLYFG